MKNFNLKDFPNNNSHYHQWILTLFILLTSIGLINLYSASHEVPNYFSKQVYFSILATLICISIAYLIPISILNQYSYIIFALTIIALALVLALGYSAGGAKRWLVFAGFRFQPSEFAKISIILLTSKFVYNMKLNYYNFKDLSPLLILIILNFTLIFLQPDLGTAGICLIIAFSQILFIRIHVSTQFLINLISLIVITGIIGWNYLLRRTKNFVF